MKINNIKKLKLSIKLSLAIVLFLIGVLVGNFIFFYAHQKEIFYFILIASVFLLGLIALNIISYRYLDYEHSGEVLTIKYYHPFHIGRVMPKLEVPRNKIKAYMIQKSGAKYSLILIVETRSKVERRFKFCLRSFSNSQVLKIQNSLAEPMKL